MVCKEESTELYHLTLLSSSQHFSTLKLIIFLFSGSIFIFWKLKIPVIIFYNVHPVHSCIQLLVLWIQHKLSLVAQWLGHCIHDTEGCRFESDTRKGIKLNQHLVCCVFTVVGTFSGSLTSTVWRSTVRGWLLDISLVVWNMNTSDHNTFPRWWKTNLVSMYGSLAHV